MAPRTDPGLRSRLRRLAPLVLLGAALLAHGCRSVDAPAPATRLTLTPQEAIRPSGPPTVVRLVLRLQAGQFQLVSAQARRGTVLEVDPEAAQDGLFAGETALLRYTTRDSLGAVLDRGYFVVPVAGVAEFLDPDQRHRIRRRLETRTAPVVRTTVPYAPRLASVTLESLAPQAGQPWAEWKARPAGRFALDLAGNDEVPQPDDDEEDDDVVH